MRDIVFYAAASSYDPRLNPVEFRAEGTAFMGVGSGLPIWGTTTKVRAYIYGSVVMEFTVDSAVNVTQAMRTAMDVLILHHGNSVQADCTSPPAQWRSGPCS